MKKQFRIKDTREFSQIMNCKQFYVSPSMVIYVKKRKEDWARVGLSVGKRMGNAVVRNKIKRQIREMVHELYTFDEEFDTIILVREQYRTENYINNKKCLERLLKKVKIVK